MRDRGTGATGLEPATSGVTGRRSNQLNYAPVGRGIVAAVPVSGRMTARRRFGRPRGVAAVAGESCSRANLWECRLSI